MERGFIGKTPRPPQMADDSYLDYMTAVRNFAIRGWFPEVAEEVATTAAAADLPPLLSRQDFDQIEPALENKNSVGAWKRVMFSQQKLTWSRLFDTYNADRDGWIAKLDKAAADNPDRLHLDPDFEVPESACLDIHMQPGGYCRDELAGYVFHHGTRVFYQGDNEQDELHDSYADCLRVPEHGPLNKILDLGCSIGQCTTALKERHPAAEVWGLDVGLPLLRYAHKRATDLGSDVHFTQGLAEDLKFADESVDAVFAYILFHEVPEHTFEAIVREAFRVLRPGGTFTVVDAPNADVLPAPNRMWLAFDARYNCEPYSPAFVALNFPGLVEKCGFADVEHGPTHGFLARTAATKPL